MLIISVEAQRNVEERQRRDVVKTLIRRIGLLPKLDTIYLYGKAIPVSYNFRSVVIPKNFESTVQKQPVVNVDVANLDYLRRLYESGK